MAATWPIERETEAGQPVLVARPAARVALIALNRPHVLNAIDRPLMTALTTALKDAVEDMTVGAIVLTGTGRAFCSGDDLKALQRESIVQFTETIEGLQSITRALFVCPKPIVAALNGPAYGAGLELVLACDVRIASEAFVAATPEVRLGLLATNGTSLLLPLLVGQSRARQMVLGGEPKSAAWCLDSGLIDELVTAEALVPRALALAGEMTSGAPGAVAAARRLMNAPLAAALEAALRLEAEACVAARGTAECAEGIAAHSAGRPPKWGEE